MVHGVPKGSFNLGFNVFFYYNFGLSVFVGGGGGGERDQPPPPCSRSDQPPMLIYGMHLRRSEGNASLAYFR